MCTALAIAGLALSAGNAILHTAAMGNAARARDDALAAERVRQRGYDDEAAALNTQSQNRYQNFSDQQEQKAQDLGDYFGKAQAAEPAAAAAMPTSQSAITVAEEGKQRAAATDYTTQQGDALGNLRAFGDLVGDIGRRQARDARSIGQIGNFKRGSSDVLPFELDQANQSSPGLKTFADLLGVASESAMSAGTPRVSLEDLFRNAAPSAVTMTTGGIGSDHVAGLRLGRVS